MTLKGSSIMSDENNSVTAMTAILVDPKQWGPHVWATIDIFVAGYGDNPDQKLRNAATNFFSSLGELLPCPHCRAHYKMLLIKRPVQTALENSASLTQWVKWIKAEVNNVVNEKRQSMEHKSADLPIHDKKMPQNITKLPKKRRTLMFSHPLPPPVRKRNLGKSRNIPRFVSGASSYTTAKKNSYQQHQAAIIAANWKGSKSGLRSFIRADSKYHRPCACN